MNRIAWMSRAKRSRTAGPHHLDRERALRAVGIEHRRLVDLGDGRRGDRLAEGGEQRRDRLAEFLLDDAQRHPLREGRNPILKSLQIARGGHADDVGAGRQELAELDVGGTEPGQRPLQRARAGGLRDAAPLQRAAELEREPQMRRQLRRIDQRQPALTGEHEADMGAAGEVEDGAEHHRTLTGICSKRDRTGSPTLEHRPERWPPAFGKRRCRNRSLEHRPGSDIRDDALSMPCAAGPGPAEVPVSDRDRKEIKKSSSRNGSRRFHPRAGDG
ncbi:hypothetical protein M2440_002703 [Methylorubrum extorquens]|nr:hypothetical protein [Methylorubrum extorquens]